jgi:hypothetical protein
MFQFFFPTLSRKSPAPMTFSSSQLLCSSPTTQAASPMPPPTEVAGDEMDRETVISGDDDPILNGFVVDSFSQVHEVAHAPRSIHGVIDRGLDVGGRVGGGC